MRDEREREIFMSPPGPEDPGPEDPGPVRNPMFSRVLGPVMFEDPLSPDGTRVRRSSLRLRRTSQKNMNAKHGVPR